MRFAALVCLLAAGCTVPEKSENITTESRQTTPYNKIEVAGRFDITIKSGEEFSLNVTGDDKSVSLVETNVEGDTLVLKSTVKRAKHMGYLNAHVWAHSPSVVEPPDGFAKPSK